jgi:hypothetical protein
MIRERVDKSESLVERDQFEQLSVRWEENSVMCIVEIGYHVTEKFHVVSLATSRGYMRKW